MLMTQNKLKLMTILVNLLATHLAIIDRELTFEFVNKLVKLIEKSFTDKEEDLYHKVKS